MGKKKPTLALLLEGLNFQGHISLRRDGSGELQYIGGGWTGDIVRRYGGYTVMETQVINDVLVIYVD